MRSLISVVLLGGGCSLIYNPSNLPEAPAEAGIPIDATVDATVVVDANPQNIVATAVDPATINEGQGDGGGRPAMIVVTGDNIIPGATLTVLDHATGAAYAHATVDTANTVVSDDHKQIAAPVTFPSDGALAAGATVDLDVVVTQMVGGTPVSAKVTGKLQLLGLAELTDSSGLDGNHALASGVHTYSKIDIEAAASNTFGLTYADNGAPLQVRSVGSVLITKPISVNAQSTAAGPGGYIGGAGGKAGLSTSPGTDGGGDGGGKHDGGGGGFGSPGKMVSGAGVPGTTAGEPSLLDLGKGAANSAHDAAGGGAGGGGGTLVAGGAGGAGGGSLEITAGGTLMISGAITAKGGTGTAGTGTGGGGGAGGAVLLRAGASASVGSIDVTGGAAAGSSSAGGGTGRVRVDSPEGSALGYQGPMFFAKPLGDSQTLITRKKNPTITVRGEKGSTIGYFTANADRSQINPVATATLGDNGQITFTLAHDLAHGLNHVCLLAEGAMTSNAPAEAQNCIDIVYLFAL